MLERSLPTAEGRRVSSAHLLAPGVSPAHAGRTRQYASARPRATRPGREPPVRRASSVAPFVLAWLVAGLYGPAPSYVTTTTYTGLTTRRKRSGTRGGRAARDLALLPRAPAASTPPFVSRLPARPAYSPADAPNPRACTLPPTETQGWPARAPLTRGEPRSVRPSSPRRRRGRLRPFPCSFFGWGRPGPARATGRTPEWSTRLPRRYERGPPLGLDTVRAVDGPLAHPFPTAARPAIGRPTREGAPSFRP